MKLVRLGHLLWAIFLLAQLPTRAAAEEDANYTKAISRGIAEFEDRNFPEARAHFARAHAIDPSARTSRALGMAEFELKNYVESAQHLEAALSASEKPLSERLRAETTDLLERARAYLGTVRLQVKPSSATLRVDGSPMAWKPDQPLILTVGDHSLELAAAGYAPETERLRVIGGEQKVLRVELRSSATGPRADAADETRSAPLAPATRADGEERPLRKSPWLWTAVGIVVAGAAAGVAIALTRDEGTRTRPRFEGTAGAPALGAP